MSPMQETPPWEHLFLAATNRSLEAGSALFERGSSPGEVFLVVSGTLSVHGTEEIGRKHPGDLVGEAAALAGGDRAVTVLAVDDARVASLPADEFIAGLEQDPSACLAVARYVATQLLATLAR